MRLYLLFFTIMLLTTGCNQNQSAEKNVLTVAFNCDDNTSLKIRFFPSPSKAILYDGNITLELPQVISGSGFRYNDGRTTLLGKGNDILLETKDEAPRHCTAE